MKSQRKLAGEKISPMSFSLLCERYCDGENDSPMIRGEGNFMEPESEVYLCLILAVQFDSGLMGTPGV